MKSSIQNLSKKSLLAYFKSIVFSFIRFIIILFFSVILLSVLDHYKILPLEFNTALEIVMVVTFIVVFVYNLWYTASYKLYYDKEGVWVYSGVLPWERGVNGIKWRDLDEAVYVVSPVSWFTNSYNIILTHRYTKSKEISLLDMKNGSKVVSIINEEHNKLIENNKIK